jgi:hypothetical protein
MNKRITADDFFTGLFAALALRGLTTLSLRDDAFDKAVARTFNKLQRMADEEGLNIRFRIRLHPLHGDSAIVRDSITNAVKRDLISLDNPVYQDIRLKLNPSEAEQYLSELPGGAPLFRQLVEEFLHSSGSRTEPNALGTQKTPRSDRAVYKRPATAVH